MLRDGAVLLTGIGLCAGALCVVDATLGRRHRSPGRSTPEQGVGGEVDADGNNRHDTGPRASGPTSDVRGVPQQRKFPVDDRVLAERVRSRLGPVVPHPQAIDVEASSGQVTLRGWLPPTETDRVLRAVVRVAGVRAVVNALDAQATTSDHDEIDTASTPQPGAGLHVGRRPRRSSTRLVIGAAATALVGYGASRSDISGALLAATGIGMLSRSINQ